MSKRVKISRKMAGEKLQALIVAYSKIPPDVLKLAKTARGND